MSSTDRGEAPGAAGSGVSTRQGRRAPTRFGRLGRGFGLGLGLPLGLGIWLAVPFALGAATAAPAAVLVYHSPADDGVPAASPPVLDASAPENLDLYVDLPGTGATQSGIACESGDGTELCGWDFTLRASPGVGLYDFLPEAGVVAQRTGKTLRVNGLHARNPATAPVRIGRLRVVRESESGGTVAVRGVAVAADLSLETLPPTTIAQITVPEPALGVQIGWMMSIVAGVAAHSGRRSRNRGGRPGRDR